jgi:UDP-N-acetylmuramate--alanine ligase
VFQPHRYSRTQFLYNQFIDVLSLSDELLLLDIYSAGENAIPGVSSESLAKEIRNNDKRVTMVNEESLKAKLDEYIKDGDVILMQGAGSIGQMALNLMKTA